MLQSYEALRQSKESSAGQVRQRRETEVKSVAVLGMHRSGISAVASALSAMGLYAGAEQESSDKSRGRSGQPDTTVICEDLLQRSGLDWWKLSEFVPDGIAPEAIHDNRGAIRELMDELDSHGNWALADPRLCLLLPLFREVRETSLAVCVVRDPVEVAQSLEKRNGIPLHAGFALWELYNRALIRHVRDLERVVVSYNRLMANPSAEIAAMVRGLSKVGIEGMDALAAEAAVEPSLHHERGDGSDLPVLLQPNQKRLWNALSRGRLDRLSTAPSRAAIATLREYEADAAEGRKHNGSVRSAGNGVARARPEVSVEPSTGPSTTREEYPSMAAKPEELASEQGAAAYAPQPQETADHGERPAGADAPEIERTGGRIEGSEARDESTGDGAAARDRQAGIRELASDLAERDELIAHLRDDAAEKRRVLDARRADLARYEERLRELEEAMASRDEKLAERTASLEAREKDVALLKNRCDAEMKERAVVEEKLEERAREIMDLSQSLIQERYRRQERERGAADLRAELIAERERSEQHQARMCEQQAAIEHLQETAASYAEAVQTLLASRSWRITRPLRFAGALGRSIVHYARRLGYSRVAAYALRRFSSRRG